MSVTRSNTESTNSASDAIAARMETVRSGLSEEADELSDRVRKATDWRHQVGQHPAAAAGLAALVGFWLVPSRPVVRRPDAATLQELARREKLVVTDKPVAEKQNGLIAAALAVGANFALRAATAYVGQQAGQIFGEDKAVSGMAEEAHA